MYGNEATNGVPLTDEEREVLSTALDEGYFEVPRRLSTVALAQQVEMSDTTVSEYLRRGITKVLADHDWNRERPPP